MFSGKSQHAEGLISTHGRIEELEFDDAFAEHMAANERAYAKHRVSEQEIREAWLGDPAYVENVGERRRESIIMLGRTRGGRILVVPLQPTHRWGVWRPVTAFEANAHHKKRYSEEITDD